MGGTGFVDIDQARELVRSAMDAVRELTAGAFWKIGSDDLLELGQECETLHRMTWATNVHLAGELVSQGVAAARSVSSTQRLLVQTLSISNAEAKTRVDAALQVLPRETPTGVELPPLLPTLTAALDAGQVSFEHTRTIVATMKKLPAPLPVEDRDFCERALVGQAAVLDPSSLDKLAKALLDAADPDGDLDETDPKSKMEFHFGSRNTRTRPDRHQRPARRPRR